MIYVDFVNGQLFESTNDTDTTGSHHGSNASVKKIDFVFSLYQKSKHGGVWNSRPTRPRIPTPAKVGLAHATSTTQGH